VELVEKHIGAKVEEVVWNDSSLIEQMVEQSPGNKNIILDVKNAAQEYWDSGIKDAPASREILDLFPPKRTASDILEELLKR
jgi:hypothetical protein